MFCPNCGNPVSKEDNFCPNCGKKLKDLPYGIHSQPKQAFHNSMDETRVFHPKALDGIDATDDIKNIIHAVDEKISENIKKYESQKFLPLSEDQISEQETSPSAHPRTSHHRDDQFHMSQSELVRRVQEELKREGYDESKVDTDFDEIPPADELQPDHSLQNTPVSPGKEKKNSLKTLWKNFINEDDDEYSIFSGLNKTSNDKEIEKERNIEVTSAVNTGEQSWEDTMSVPKIVTAEEMEEVEEIVEKQLHDKNELQNPSSKDSSPTSHSSNPSKKNTSLKESLKKQSETSSKITKSSSERESDPNSFLGGFKKRREHIFKKNAPLQSEGNHVESSLLKETEKTKKDQKKDKTDSVKQDSSSKSYSFMDRFAHMTENFSLSVKNVQCKEAKLLIGISILLTLVPIILAQRAVGISTVVFLILRLIFDGFEYYTPLRAATDRSDTDTTPEQMKRYALLNWSICKLVLFIGFFLSPFGGFFTFPLINALTAMPICTVIISILSPAIALSFYWKELRQSPKVDFIGWYSLIFILFELFFKLIWFFIHFIFNTLF